MLKPLGLACGFILALPVYADSLSLQQAVDLAIKHDPWLQVSQHQQAAALANSEGAGYLPDPKFNLGLVNFPTDSFDYNQEAMTQVLVGVSQLLPRGETLSLQSRKWLQQAEQQRFLRQERRASVKQQVSELWLMAVKAQQSIELIEQNRILFEQLSDVATSTYSSTYGRSKQQDLVRAKLELSQLDDRLTQLQLEKDKVLAKLGPWLSSPNNPAFGYTLPEQVSSEIPMNPAAHGSPQRLLQHLAQHPSLVALEQAIAMASTGVSLAEQKYKPEWMVNASYGFRGEDSMGNSRADLFSVGVSVDVPIFSHGRQDAEVKGAIAGAEAMRTERLLMLRNLNSRLQGLYAESEQLKKRQQLYQQELIPGFALAAESAINAYTVDDGNFSDVVRARISELNAKLENLAISIELQKKVVAMNYLLTQANDAEVMDQ